MKTIFQIYVFITLFFLIQFSVFTYNNLEKNKHIKVYTLKNIYNSHFINKEFLVYDFHRKRVVFSSFENLQKGLYFIKSQTGKVYLFWSNK